MSALAFAVAAIVFVLGVGLIAWSGVYRREAVAMHRAAQALHARSIRHCTRVNMRLDRMRRALVRRPTERRHRPSPRRFVGTDS